ncbi:MAG: hypothetical protein CFE26_18580, partial [Verrucomicrobiales bacterium VVV1]
MPVATISVEMPVSSAEVFALLHDYDRRLEWDTLLSSAQLTRGSIRAGKDACSLCVGARRRGGIGIETRYVSFDEGRLAAVTMINAPPLFSKFAASIRHEDREVGSIATYKLHFEAKPRWLRWLLEPVMTVVLRIETRKR